MLIEKGNRPIGDMSVVSLHDSKIDVGECRLQSNSRNLHSTEYFFTKAPLGLAFFR